MTVIMSPVLAQDDTDMDEENLRNSVQMPIATAKASRYGASPDSIKKLAGMLHEGEVSPGNFNNMMRDGVEMDTASHNDLSDFVREKKNEGLRGRDLAKAIHEKLRSKGIPAGGQNVSPLEDDFVPPGLRKKKRRGSSSKKMKGKKNRQKRNGKGKSQKMKHGESTSNAESESPESASQKQHKNNSGHNRSSNNPEKDMNRDKTDRSGQPDKANHSENKKKGKNQ